MMFHVLFVLMAAFSNAHAFIPSYLSPQYLNTGMESNTVRFYAMGHNVVVDSSQSRSTFEERMKQRLMEQQQKHKKSESKNVPVKHGSIIQVRTLPEYKKVVANEKDRMVVVRFYAPWCQACKAMQPLFQRLCNAPCFEDVKFVEVPCAEDNAHLHQSLGVPSLPFCHIYHPAGGLVEELRFTRKHVRNVAQILHSYAQERCTELKMNTETNMFSSPYNEEKQ